MKQFIFVWFLAISSICFAETPNVPPHIKFVGSGGFWELKKQQGTYRVIITDKGWEHTSSNVYLEWIEENHNNQTLKIIYIVPISEINNTDTWAIGSPEFIYHHNKVQIKLHATHVHSQENKNFLITPTITGKYRITTAK